MSHSPACVCIISATGNCLPCSLSAYSISLTPCSLLLYSLSPFSLSENLLLHLSILPFSSSFPTCSEFAPNFQPVAMPTAKGCSPESSHLLTASSSELEAQKWLADHRFGTFLSLFSSYCGADLLRLSRKDLMDLCGPADGIRLYNTIHSR